MTEQAKACAAYFRSRPGYRRILTALLKKYRSYGRLTGTIRLDDVTQEECDALRGLFGRPFYPPLRLQAAQFEAALQTNSFQGVPLKGVSLKETLEIYFDTEIRTRSELCEAENIRFAAILTKAAEYTDNDTCIQWLQALREPRCGGYQLLRRECGRDPDTALRGLIQVCRSLEQMERCTQGSIRLAVLSAQAASDPHALDSGTLCGRLFLHLLAFRSGKEAPENAEQRDSLYYDNGILCDSISSLVTQVGLVLCVGADQTEHPAYRLFRKGHEICTLSLSSLSRLSGACSPSGRVYIVENEMVFTQLCDCSAQFHSPLICTSGQPSVAALQLLDLLAAEDTRLFYSGDFDGKGLSIAAQLCSRYPALLSPWHMSAGDYDQCRSDVGLSESSQSLLQGCSGTDLEASAEAVRRIGFVGYQELLIPQLEMDLIKTP